MIPEEKAKELVEKFNHFEFSTIDLTRSANFEMAKQCALICCDEILHDKMILGGDYKFDEFKSAKFWEQVKIEIKNL